MEHFCAQGSRVAFLDIDAAAATRLGETIGATGGERPLFLPCDLGDIAALRAAVADVRRRIGPIRVLVNNAAHDERHALDTVTPEYWDDRLAVNLRHQLFAAQAVYPDGCGSPPESEAELLRRQCLKRKLVPEDIARAVLFFAADDSAGCTAQSYVVDAGWT